MINWRSIKDVGLPTDCNKKYLVTDGQDISTSEIGTRGYYSNNIEWYGDDNTYEDNQCCSGPKCFYMKPTHWCPVDELELPKV